MSLSVLIPVRNEMAGSKTRKEVAPTEYYPNLDVLRLLSVVAIVWLHSVESPAFKAGCIWCRFAVPAFTATSVLLLVWRHGGDPGRELWNYVARRATRLYLLFLAWNCIYAIVRLLEHMVFRGGDTIRWNLETFLLAGFAEQLWFLPFLAIATVLTAVPAFLIVHNRSKVFFVGILPMIGIVLALLSAPINVNLEIHPATYWFGLSWQAFPSALMVFGILPFCKAGKFPLVSWMLALISGGLLWSAVDDGYSNLVQNAAGVLLVLSAVLAPCRIPFKQTLRQLGSLALPIYLLHPLFIHAVQAVGHRMAHWPVSMSFDGVVLVVGLVGSGLSAWYLQKIPVANWLVTAR